MATANLLQTSVSGGTQNALSLQGDGVFFPKASTTSRLALTLTTTDKGFIVYDTTDNNIYFWNGTAWESIPGSGDAGANGSVQYNDNGIVRGATNFVWDKVNGRVGIGTATPNAPLEVAGAATITGDLTVRTNKLKVDATGVGIGTTSPTSGTLTVQTHFLLFPDSQTKIGDNGLVNGVSSDGNSQIQFFGGKSLFFNEGASNTKMTLNSTGLGIGVAPQAKLHAYTLNPTDGVIELLQNLSTSGQTGAKTKYEVANVGASGIGTPNGTTNALAFFVGGITSAEERARIDASGNLLVGTTSALQISNNPAVTSRIANLGTGSKGSVILRENEVSAFWGGNLFLQKVRGTSTAVQSGDILGTVAFGGFDGTNYVNTAVIQTSVTGAVSAGVVPVKIQVVATSGGVELTNTATSWAAISDERLKDIIEPINNAVAKVGLLRSVIGKYKSDSEGTRRSFLIAQDVQSAIPEAVGGNEDSMTVRYTEVIPLLVAAIKELTARVQTLEAR